MKKEEILAICIDEIRAGRSTVEECVARYPDFGKDLRDLLEISIAVKPEAVVPSPQFKERAKLHLFDDPQHAPVKSSHRFWSWHEMTPVKILASVLIGVLILAVAGGTTVYAAQSSLPGDALYSVKTGAENVQLALTTSTASKVNLYLKIAQRRVDEVTRQLALGRKVNPSTLDLVTRQYNNALTALSASTNSETTTSELSNLTLKSLNQSLELEQALSSAVPNSQPVVQQIISTLRRGNTLAQVAYANKDLLQQPLSVNDPKLDAGQFIIEGTLINIRGLNWNIGGTFVENIRFSGEIPAIGSRVKLTGLVKNNILYVSSLEVIDSSPAPTTIQGQVEGTNPNGAVVISGIPVSVTGESAAQLTTGDNVQLESNTANGKLNVTGKITGATAPAVTGVLSEVNVNTDILTIKMSGSLVKIDVSRASIQYYSGVKPNFSLSDLQRYLGQEIRLSGLSKSNGILSANLIQVRAQK
jgi:hypothetical protein